MSANPSTQIRPAEAALRFSACVEWLFSDDTDDFCERIQLAQQAGLAAVEFWTWRDKDLDAIRRTLDATGLTLTAILLEPLVAMTDPNNKAACLAGVRASVEAARRVGARALMAQVGDSRPDMTREAQRSSIVTCLRDAAAILEGTGVTLLVEPLNTKIDHPGYFLDDTTEGLDIVGAVDHPNIRLLHDLYHSTVMGENPTDVLQGRVHLVGHVHLADAPGRHEPGSGAMDWRNHLQWLRNQGYQGWVGLEYKPKARTMDGLRFRERAVNRP